MLNGKTLATEDDELNSMIRRKSRSLLQMWQTATCEDLDGNLGRWLTMIELTTTRRRNRCTLRGEEGEKNQRSHRKSGPMIDRLKHAKKPHTPNRLQI